MAPVGIAALVLVGTLAQAPAPALQGLVLRADTGEPVAHGEVLILGRPGTARTDAGGRFTWSPVPSPPFEVLVIAPGGLLMAPVLVEQIADPLVLRVSPVMQEALTVTGAAPGVASTPASGTTLVARGDLEARVPANLTQALENVAGVAQVSEGHAATPAIRGLARGRTLVLLDGARVTSERRVGPSGSFLDPFVIDDVQVVRGPGSVAYGSDAFGGVIAARTRGVAPGAPLSVRASATLGRAVPERRAGVELARGFGGGGVLFTAHARNVDHYRSPEGLVLNSGYRDRGVLAKATGVVGAGLLSAGWQSSLGRDVGRPRTNSHQVRFFYPVEDMHRLTVSHDTTAVSGFDHVGTMLFLGRHVQVTDQDRVPTAATPRSLERADVAARDFQVRSSAGRALGPARVALGLDVNGRHGLRALDIRERFDLDGRLVDRTVHVSVERARRVDLGVFGTVDVPVAAWLSASGGLRGDRVTAVNTGGFFGARRSAHTAVSGYAAVTAQLGSWTAAGQVARGFRDPTLSDRFYRGPTGRGFITGNPDLHPERSVQVDGSLRYTGRRARVGIFGYRYRIDDLVERYQTSPDVFFFRNRGRARLHGVELEGQIDLTRSTRLELSAQSARGRVLDEATYLDDVTPDRLAIQVRRLLPGRAFAQVRAAWYAADRQPGPTEVEMPAHTVIDLSAGLPVGRRLEVRGLLRNALDEAYPVSPDPRAVLAPGRSLFVTAAARF